MSDKPETLAAILAEMRKSAKDSYAEKTAKRLEDHEATGTRDALDIKDAIQCLRDDDKYLLDLADRIEAATERERAGTIYAGRNGEMTLDECIVRCDNNSGDNPRGRDVAQIGGWLRELRERRNAPGNAAAMREALEQALAYCESDQKSGIAYSDNDVLVPMLREARAALGEDAP